MGMKRLALVLALANGATGCAHQQLTNRQVAAGAVTAAAVITLILLLSVQCNELTMQCHR
jgi:methionine-rich copper-binding protein CopC